MIQHLYTRSFMLMILGSLLSFGWVMAQEEPPDEPDEAVVPLFDLTDSDVSAPPAQVAVFDPPQGLTSTMMGLTMTYAFSQDFDDPSNWEGLIIQPGLSFAPGRTGNGLRIPPQVDPVFLEHGYLRDLNLQMDLALGGSTAQIMAKGSGAGAYWVTLSADGRVELSKAGALLGGAQFAVAEWLRVRLVIEGTQIALGINGDTVIRATDPSPLPPGVVQLVPDYLGEGSYTVDNLVFSGVIAPPPEPVTPHHLSLQTSVSGRVDERLVFKTMTLVPLAIDIHTIRPDGTGRTNLTSDLIASASQPQWSPDGRQIAFVSKMSGTYHIHVVDADGGNRRQVTTGTQHAIYPSWSPDGGQIAFVRGGAVWRTSSAGMGGDVLLFRSPSLTIYQVAWSPQGDRLALQGDVPDLTLQFGIYVVDRDGGNLRQVSPGTAGGGNADWSPDGRRILYSVSGNNRAYPSGIYIQDISTTTARRLTGGRDGTWSPDGQEIALLSLSNQLVRVNAQTGQQTGVILVVGRWERLDRLDWRGASPTITTTPTPTPTPTDTPRGGLCSSVLLSDMDDMLCAAPPTTCNGTLIAANLYYLDRPNGRLLGIMAVDAGTGIEALYRDNSGEWHAIRFRYQGQQYAGWVTATHPEWIRFANAQGQACDLEVHPDYRPTPTPTATPTPTNTPTPTPTPTPLPVRLDVPTEALPFHQLARQIGLPLPFDRLPVAAADYNWAQGYGANAFAYENQATYGGTHGIHTGLDYGWSLSQGSSRARPIYALCDGVVRSGRTGGGGGTTASGLGITLRCFADDPPDPDGDGKPNLSNLILSYNHVATKSVSVGACVSTGTVLGTAGTGKDPHLHLEMFLDDKGTFSGQSALRLNPLLMFRKAMVDTHSSKFGPYFPDLSIEEQEKDAKIYGLDAGDIHQWSLLGDKVGSTGPMFAIQDANTPGPDWPANTIPNIVTFLASRGYGAGSAAYSGSNHTCQ